MKILAFIASLLMSAVPLAAQEYKVEVSEADEPMMKGRFEPSWQSLEQYQVPDWFRNVKFGIWRIGGRSASRAAATGWRA